MFDVNPVGPLMHLKELERQAAAARRLERSGLQSGNPSVFVSWLVRMLSRLRAGVKAHPRKTEQI